MMSKTNHDLIREYCEQKFNVRFVSDTKGGEEMVGDIPDGDYDIELLDGIRTVCICDNSVIEIQS